MAIHESISGRIRMSKGRDRGDEKKGKSRISSAVLSLILPGLGQIMRGRVLAGLLFFMNVVLYCIPLFVSHKVEYDVRTPSFLIAAGVYACAALDAFLYRSSFLVMALLVSLFCFGSGFFGAFFILPHLNI
jgi:hypothetical protein